MIGFLEDPFWACYIAFMLMLLVLTIALSHGRRVKP